MENQGGGKLNRITAGGMETSRSLGRSAAPVAAHPVSAPTSHTDTVELEPIALSPEQQTRYKNLLDVAVGARNNAYAPNSHSLVGTAVLGGSGKIYTGGNYEFTRYADHGEQVAINRALTAGEKTLEAVAIFVAPEGPVQDKHYHGNSCPCGNCRQALFELNPNMLVVQADGPDKVKAFRLAEFLPSAYQRQWPKFQHTIPQKMADDPLVQSAQEACSRSLAVRTGFPEGAAVETSDGQIFSGSKVELSSFASQAERMAVADAFQNGHRDIKRVAIVGGSGRSILPPSINWDSLQALSKINSSMTVVHPDQSGQLIEEPLRAFLMGQFDSLQADTPTN